MSRLVDDLLELSRIGRVPLTRKRVDLSALASEVASELARSDDRRSVSFEITPGIEVEADPGLVRIVLDNLLGNAWKFTSKSTIQRVRLFRVPGSDPSELVVEDTGAGFDEALATRLFAPFQRLHPAEAFPGTGIGLATVQRVVDRHGGRIWAEGRAGEGARFHFTLAPRKLPSVTGAHDEELRDV